MMIEFAAATLDDVLSIEKSGADRIMLASSLNDGGITASIGFTVLALGAVKLPVDVLIRPHNAGFCYSPADLDVIEADLYAAVETRASRVVLSMLDANGNVNVNMLERFIPRFREKGIVFGRAIDETNDIVESARIVSTYEEVKAVLTTGGKGDFGTRMENIRKMREVAPELEIIVCGGIGVENIEEIRRLTGANSFLAGTPIREIRNVIMGVDEDKVSGLVKAVRNLA